MMQLKRGKNERKRNNERGNEMKKFNEMIREIPAVEIHVRKNIDYSTPEIYHPGFIAKAVDINTDEISEETFLSIDDIYKRAVSQNCSGEIKIFM